MITEIAGTFKQTPVIAITAWFNNSLWKPLQKFGSVFSHDSRSAIEQFFDLPGSRTQSGPGRPKKYGKKLGNASSLAVIYKNLAKEYTVLYGRIRTVSIVVMLKRKCPVPLSQDPVGCTVFYRSWTFPLKKLSILQPGQELKRDIQRCNTDQTP